jgi:hypothetical protein
MRRLQRSKAGVGCRSALGAGLASALMLSALHPLHAQGVLVRGSTTVNFLEMRALVADSVPFTETTPGLFSLRQLSNGQVVSCGEGDPYCRFYRSGAIGSTLPMLQDFDVTAWGLGQGLSAHANLRFRGAAGSQRELWPRVNDRFDALSAYLQLDRTRYTVRAGRHFTGTGLGVYNFDGATLVLRPMRRLTVEGFAGRSLVQGVNESLTTSELAALDELPPDRNAWLLGAQFTARPLTALAMHGVYQRELRDNRSALYSERVAMDATWRVGGGSVDGAWQQDLATATTNELRLRVRAPRFHHTTLSAEVRQYRPFFELWTIWGAFSPVGFNEGRVQAGWLSPNAALSFDVHGARRRWEDTDAGLGFAALRREGWRLGGSAAWRMASAWHLNGSYSADIGAGASRTEGDLGLHFTRGAVFVGANATAFQSIYEFRVGTGRVIGFGGDAGWQVHPELRLVGTATAYRQLARNALPSTDWTQRRATMRLEWTLGSDPGMRGVRAAARKQAARERGSAELARFGAVNARAVPAAASSSVPERQP